MKKLKVMVVVGTRPEIIRLSEVIKAIDKYFEANAHEDSYICLIANHPAELLYKKHKFEYLPENKCGMLRNQSNENKK